MLVPAEVWTVARAQEGNAVLIRPTGSDVAVPIYIDQNVAHSILIGLGDVQVPRPLTHDLFLTVLRELDTKISRIEITEIRDGTYFARLVLGGNGAGEVIVDSRPSDCIALAVRIKCPIFIDEDVVEEAGIPVSAVAGGEDQDDEPTSDEPEDELGRLQRLLSEAVETEDYEEAARLRDQIQELEGSS